MGPEVTLALRRMSEPDAFLFVCEERRVPVREACRRLQQEGLVDSIPYRGYFAKPISVKEISDSFDLRLVLETHAAVLATERASAEDLDRLEALGAVGYTPRDPDSYEEFLDRNLRFHAAIAEMAGNRRLTRALRDLVEGMQRFFFLGLDLGDYGSEMREEHERLIELMRRRDAEGVQACIRDQIEESRRRILMALERDGPKLPDE